MSLSQWEKRLARIEANNKQRGRPWTDPFDAAAALLEAFEAVQAGRACWMPQPEEPLSPEVQKQFEIAMRDADRMHKRLMAERAGEAR